MPSKATLAPTELGLAARDGEEITLERLDSLLMDGEDNGFLRPRKYAMATARSLLTGAKARMRAQFPPGSPSADGAGGLRIEWQCVDRAVRLTVPPKSGGRSYIYHEAGIDYGADPSVSEEALAFWLDWLLA